MGTRSKVKWCLLGCLAVVLVFVTGSVFVPDGLTNTVRWLASSNSTGQPRGLSGQEAARADTLSEMVVERITISKIDYQPVVILKEKDGDIYLPIWIGSFEANAIAVVLEGVAVRRPLTPDLLYSILDRMEASVDYIVINDLRDHTFYAKISVKANWRQMEIDARPSDAIAIALRAKAPIYAARSVLERAGIKSDQETEKYTVIYTHR